MSYEAISLEHEGKALALGSAVFPLRDNNCYIIPFEATSDIPVGDCVLQLEQVQFNYHQELQAANVPDTSVISANIPGASEAATEFRSLSAGVNRLVQNGTASTVN